MALPLRSGSPLYSLDLLFCSAITPDTPRVGWMTLFSSGVCDGLAIESLAAEAPPTVRWMFLCLWEGL